MYQMPDNSGLADPADRVGYLLWQTAHLVSRRMTVALEPFAVTPAQFSALVHIGREPGVSAAELARRINLTPQSTQTALRQLLEREWVQRRPHPVHRRVLGNFLTVEGRAGTERASAAVTQADAELVVDLTGEEAAVLRDHLIRVLLALNPAALDRSSLRSRD